MESYEKVSTYTKKNPTLKKNLIRASPTYLCLQNNALTKVIAKNNILKYGPQYSK